MVTYRTPGGVRVDSMIDLKFEFKPTIAMSAKAFDTLSADVRSFREPLKRSIQRVIAPSIGQNFRSHGRPVEWTPLSDSTLQMKAQAGSKYPVEYPLLRSGLLYRTMQQYNIWTVTRDQAAILDLPPKIWYGKIHQAGYGMPSAVAAGGSGEAGFMEMVKQVLGGGYRAYIPARPFAMVQVEDLDRIQEVFGDWIEERVAARLALFARRSQLCLTLAALRPLRPTSRT